MAAGVLAQRLRGASLMGRVSSDSEWVLSVKRLSICLSSSVLLSLSVAFCLFLCLCLSVSVCLFVCVCLSVFSSVCPSLPLPPSLPLSLPPSLSLTRSLARSLCGRQVLGGEGRRLLAESALLVTSDRHIHIAERPHSRVSKRLFRDSLRLLAAPVLRVDEGTARGGRKGHVERRGG
eukprot:1490801-Rhodomonas_salina.2